MAKHSANSIGDPHFRAQARTTGDTVSQRVLWASSRTTTAPGGGVHVASSELGVDDSFFPRRSGEDAAMPVGEVRLSGAPTDRPSAT
jgi:hypothetical protein